MPPRKGNFLCECGMRVCLCEYVYVCICVCALVFVSVVCMLLCVRKENFMLCIFSAPDDNFTNFSKQDK